MGLYHRLAFGTGSVIIDLSSMPSISGHCEGIV